MARTANITIMNDAKQKAVELIAICVREFENQTLVLFLCRLEYRK